MRVHAVKLVARCNLVKARDGLQDCQKVRTPGSGLYCLHLDLSEINPWPGRRSLDNLKQFAAATCSLPLSPYDTLLPHANKAAGCRNHPQRVLPGSEGKVVRQSMQAFAIPFRMYSPPATPPAM